MKRFMYLIFILSLTAGAVLFAQQKKIKVITTLHYLKYVTEQVGGNRVTVTALSNPKQDPHYVTATPTMNQLSMDADLFIENGLGLDLWAKNVVDASGNPRIQSGNPGHLIASLNVPVKELPFEISRAWGDIHPQGNPHVWLDPLNIKIIAENIMNRLIQLDAANASDYRTRLSAFVQRIDEEMFGASLLKNIGGKAGDILSRKTRNGDLYSWLSQKGLAEKLGGWMKIAQDRGKVRAVAYHKTYIYFADRFGVEIASEIEEKPGIPPPPQHRDAIIALIKKEKIPIILHDNFYPIEASEYIASASGAALVTTYIDVDAQPRVTTYEGLITELLNSVHK